MYIQASKHIYFQTQVQVDKFINRIIGYAWWTDKYKKYMENSPMLNRSK